jgi:hypothetical protein
VHDALAFLRPTAALRRLGVRLAFVAVLAAALMPTFSRLAQPGGIAEWAAICQSTPTSPSGPSQDSAHAHDDACAYCTLAHTTPALLDAVPVVVAAIEFAPPAPLAPAPVRAGVPQARAPSARAPPSLA